MFPFHSAFFSMLPWRLCNALSGSWPNFEVFYSIGWFLFIIAPTKIKNINQNHALSSPDDVFPTSDDTVAFVEHEKKIEM